MPCIYREKVRTARCTVRSVLRTTTKGGSELAVKLDKKWVKATAH